MDIQTVKELNIDIHMAHTVVNCKPEQHMIPWRRLFDYEILFVVDGTINVKTQNETYAVRKNQVHFMPPFLYHTRFINQGESCTYYGIHADLFPADGEEFSIYDAYIKPIEKKGENYSEQKSWINRRQFNGIKVPKFFDVFNVNKITLLFKEIVKLSNKKTNNSLLLKAKGFELLHYLSIECEKNNIELITYNKNLHEDIILNFIEEVKNNYANPFDMNAITFNYGISKNHFSKIFKNATGLAPMNFLISYRINKAKELLQTGKYFVYEVSTMVGYNDYTYFARVFKSKIGLSPSNYYKKIQKNNS